MKTKTPWLSLNLIKMFRKLTTIKVSFIILADVTNSLKTAVMICSVLFSYVSVTTTLLSFPVLTAVKPEIVFRTPGNENTYQLKFQ